MNKKLPAALCILLTIPIMVSATTYISIDIQDNKSVNNEKKDYPTPDRNKIIAFPGADGAGKYTTGGAGGTVYIVTSLADDGSEGTFRWAINQKGTRTIVFAVDGIIELQKPLRVNNGDLTIAGQTAPGDGICLKNYTFSIQADNVIVRFIRSRMGVDIKQKGDDAMNGIKNHQNIIIDHCSMSWSTDECATFYNNRNFTLQWCIISESLANSIHEKGAHGYGGIWGGQTATFHHNLLAHHTNRTPRLCGSRYTGKPEEEKVDLFNNVIYNYGSDGAYAGEGGSYNFINNYYKPGPATPKDTPVGHRILKPEAGRSKLDHKVYGRVYADGNIMEGYPAITEDNWAGGIQIETQPNTEGYTENMRSNRPFEMPYIRITSAHDAYDFVLKNAGANIPCRDIVDERIIEEVRTGVPYYDKKMAKDANGDLTGLAPKSMGEDGQFKYRRLPKDSYKQGIITDIRQMGGYPEYKGTPYVDTDGDGMPDEWEKANGLNPNDPSDANKDCTGDGYTNIEKYINGISTRNCIDWSDLRNNYDTLASKGKLM